MRFLEIFLEFFWRISLGGILTLLKSTKLFEYGRIDLIVKILSKSKKDGRKE